MEITGRRRARFIGLLLGTAIVLGLIYGGLLVALDRPGYLFTWWATCLRGVAAVLICFAVAGAVDRRLAARPDEPALTLVEPPARLDEPATLSGEPPARLDEPATRLE